MEQVTLSDAGLSQDAQIQHILTTIVNNGGVASTQQFYDSFNALLNRSNQCLADAGKSSLRRLVNSTAVQAGFIYPHDPRAHGEWRITPEGRSFIEQYTGIPEETVFNTDTQREETIPSNVARATEFEHYCIELLKRIYPRYVWFHQGRFKKNERGLDIIGDRLGEGGDEPKSIGVQVKLHAPNAIPTNTEWLKFMAGCFVRGIDLAVFITTGGLSGEQRREAGEGRVIVIEGQEEITRQAQLHGVRLFAFGA